MATGLTYNLPSLSKTPNDATITYSSSDPSVASFTDETVGTVTLKKPGTATITASFAGDEDYRPTTGTFALTVTNSASATIYSWEGTPAGAIETGGTMVAYATDGGTEETASVVNTETNPSSSTYDFYNTVLKGKNDFSTNVVKVTLSTSLKEGDIITVTGFRDKDTKEKKTGFKAKFNVGSSVISTSTGYEFVNINASVSTEAEYGTTPNSVSFAVPADAAGSTIITMTRAETSTNFFMTKLEIASTSQTMSISSATWATFSSASEVAIPDGVMAYRVSADNGSTVTISEITGGIIPANTGVILHGDEYDYAAYYTATGASIGTNLLQPWITEGTPTPGSTYYTLGIDGENNPVFRQSTGGTLAAGKAYLVLPAGEAPAIIRVVDEGNNATNLEKLNSTDNAVKFIENGRLLILCDGITYDALGRVIR